MLNLTTLLTAGEHNTQICGQQLFRSVRAPQHSSEDRSAALRNEIRFRVYILNDADSQTVSANEASSVQLQA